jgi:hypothetical protein
MVGHYASTSAWREACFAVVINPHAHAFTHLQPFTWGILIGYVHSDLEGRSLRVDMGDSERYLGWV